MAEWKPDIETEQLLKEMERFTGRKCPPATEEQMNASLNSLLAWDKAGRPFDEKVTSDTDTFLSL